MINGLQRAGQNPTRAGVIKALRSIKSYNGNGLLPITINYSTVFGHDLPQCAWVLRADKSGFVPISSKPVLWHGLRRHEPPDKLVGDTELLTGSQSAPKS